MEKVYNTAVVIIPPEELWEPIQEIRREYDKQVRRWMPHITMLYPFYPKSKFDSYKKIFSFALKDFEAFEVKLGEFKYYHHRKENYTIWLHPEPKDKVVKLQEALLGQVPSCYDVNQFRGGFSPHLSVGQIKSKVKVNSLLKKLRDDWNTISFVVDKVALIWRHKESSKVPFKIIKEVDLKNFNVK